MNCHWRINKIGLKFNSISFIFNQLTPAAVKDYNRGRAYLIDVAERQQIPVFRDIRQAVDCAIEKVKQSKRHESS